MNVSVENIKRLDNLLGGILGLIRSVIVGCVLMAFPVIGPMTFVFIVQQHFEWGFYKLRSDYPNITAVLDILLFLLFLTPQLGIWFLLIGLR